MADTDKTKKLTRSAAVDLSKYRLGWSDKDDLAYKPSKGLSEELIRTMSEIKSEPEWMLTFRLRAYKRFLGKPMAEWFAVNMPSLDFNDIYYYVKPTTEQVNEWADLPDAIRSTYERLGIPEAERKYLAGVTAQYECLVGGTRIPTDSGVVQLVDLMPGDSVFSLGDGNEVVTSKVVSIHESGIKPVYEIQAGDLSIRASANHPFFAQFTFPNPKFAGARWVEVAELAVGDLVCVLDGVGFGADGDGQEKRLAKPVGRFEHITSIKLIGQERTWDIEVADTHNFCAEGFIVHNSEVVFHRNRADLAGLGVLFCDMDTAVREYPELVQKYFASVVPPGDNKFAALNSAVWSGGSFIYVPPGVKVEQPLQAYFRINSENMGQFERTLIIADEGSEVNYYEGCSAPIYSTDSLHSAVVELVAKPGAKINYTTIQNWSDNVYNLVTKRARAETQARVEWVDANIGSQLTMKYPSVYLMGPKASGEVTSVAMAAKGQHQDTGAKMIHAASETTSRITAKSISVDGGISTYRGLVHVNEGVEHTRSYVRCDALLLDNESVSVTKPSMEVGAQGAVVEHEATVSRVSDAQLFYLMSRGLSQSQAQSMIVTGFTEPLTRELPMEFAVEFNRLIEIQLDDAIG